MALNGPCQAVETPLTDYFLTEATEDAEDSFLTQRPQGTQSMDQDALIRTPSPLWPLCETLIGNVSKALRNEILEINESVHGIRADQLN